MTQKERIRKLMKIQGIENDNQLLAKIHRYLKERNSCSDYVENNKGNFSKMISGERNFPQKYIVAIEKILKTTILYIIEGEEEKSKEFKHEGLAFTAFKNNYDDYSKLDRIDNKIWKSALLGTDEFGKNILDYIIMYDSVEGIRYLVNEHEMRYLYYSDSLGTNDRHSFSNESCCELVAEILIKHDENELLNEIYNGYEMLKFSNNYDAINIKDEFKSLVLENENALLSMLNYQEFDLSHVNYRVNLEEIKKQVYFINPLVNIIYKYAVKNYDKFEEKVNLILKKCLELNKNILDNFASKYPLLKDVKVSDNGFITVKHINYTLIFNPSISNVEISEETKHLIEENKKIINEYLLKNGEAINEKNEERLLEYIYKYSGIKDTFRRNEYVLDTISEILKENNISEAYRKTLANKISEYLKNLFDQLDKNDEEYKNKYQEIKWAMIFIDLYFNELNNL